LRAALRILGAIALARAATFVIAIFNSDEAYLATMAEVLRRGGRLYLDVADRKPPLVPQIYAAVFSAVDRPSLLAIHVLATLVLWGTALLLRAFAKRHLEPKAAGAASAATWLFVVAQVAGPPADTLAANFEVFMLPACAAALLALGRGGLAYFGAGAALALATLTKQPAIVGLPVALAWVALWSRGRAGAIAGALALVAGFAAVLGVELVAIGRDAWPAAWFWTVAGNSGYLGGNALGTVLARLAGATALFALPNGVLCAGLVAALRRPAGDRATRALLWVWLSASALGVAAGLRFFGHYYLQLLPAACLLAAPAVAAWLAGPWRRRVLAALAVPAVASAIAGFWGREIHDMPRYEAIAAAVAARSAEGDRVFVWGHFPELYWASHRRPATRLIHTGFLTGAAGGRPPGPQTIALATPGAWDLLWQDFARHPPALVIDTSGARLRDYEHYPMTLFPDLLAYVERNYRLDATVEGYAVWKRR
jgi:hypothetical protein